MQLTRKFGKETIRVSFSIQDMSNLDMPYGEDKALYDDEEDGVEVADAQSGGANTKGASAQGFTADGNVKVDPAEQETMDEDEEALQMEEQIDARAEVPAHIKVAVEKPGKGTLVVETTAQAGEIIIDEMYYYTDKEVAAAKTAESDFKKRSLYEGPPFGSLDEDLQVLLERYLAERGIDTRLAVWVSAYIDWKEQKEYIAWLKSKLSWT